MQRSTFDSEITKVVQKIGKNMSSDKFKLDTLFDDNDEIIEPDGADVKKRNVAYYYHKDVGHFHYGIYLNLK